MFKSWSKKKKIRAVFQLQFQATQVPKLKKPALMLSLVPDDVGKATVKLGKAAVQDGTCIWENPVFESVKLVEEVKTGKLKEKIYHFIVSNGSSKSGYLGEASIDFADIVAETEPLSITLPLKFANSGVVLHVTIDRIREDGDQREIEESDDPSRSHHSSVDGSNHQSFNETNKGYAHRDAGSSLSPPEVPTSMPQNGHAGANGRKTHVRQKSSLDWSSDESLFDSPDIVEDKLPTGVQAVSDVDKLRNEMTALKRQADLSELELQSLRKQMAKESNQGQNLSRQIVCLKEERDALKMECEQLKSSQGRGNGKRTFKTLQPETEDTRAQLEAMKQELSSEKKARTNLRLLLAQTQDSNSELVLVVKDLEDALGKKNREISDLSSKLEAEKISKVMGTYSAGRKKEVDQEIESLKLDIRELLSEIDTHQKKREEQDMRIKQLSLDYDLLKQEKYDISMKLDRNQERIRTEMENERAGYMATIKELESQLERSEETIEKQAHEFSECLMSIQELESELKSLEMDREMQAKGFEDKLEEVMNAKVEQEYRAIQAEEALKKTRSNNSDTVERLQEEFRKLSVEMTSKVDETEKQVTKVMTEANELRRQNRILEEMLQKANEELELIKGETEVKLQDLVNQIEVKAKRIEQMSSELDNTSKQLEKVKRREEEEHEALSMKIQMLEAEIERLTDENSNSRQEKDKLRGDLEQMKKLIAENEMLIQCLSVEKENLEKRFVSAKRDTEKTLEELTDIRSLKDVKETTIASLNSEVENLKTQHSKLLDTLKKEALAKESLKKQISQLQAEVQKKVSNSKKTVKNTNGQRKVEDCSEKQLKATIDENKCTDLMTELTLLKERNKSMEDELKEMEERYSEISLRFAEVEGERQQLVMTVRNLKNSKKN
ncbi:sarcolemmal membrane-associated protein [Pyrus x bretschneideri]|uniref:sarcolemmal membrane-associated protein n=1 Tax=Pyrus x bretschneideri TaxID=225117 RepID=UPI00202E7517|nr:sarcolemmal membrane-associated protein [Pyrus x bretschneideri]XP_048421077.1 sarcolemmal membrane-associated protein [Pyrus x bretschneideri]